MNQEQIIQLARKVGMRGIISDVLTTIDELTAFANLVAQYQMEQDARICETGVCNRPDDPVANYFDGGLRHCAAAIRRQEDAKGNS